MMRAVDTVAVAALLVLSSVGPVHAQAQRRTQAVPDGVHIREVLKGLEGAGPDETLRRFRAVFPEREWERGHALALARIAQEYERLRFRHDALGLYRKCLRLAAAGSPQEASSIEAIVRLQIAIGRPDAALGFLGARRPQADEGMRCLLAILTAEALAAQGDLERAAESCRQAEAMQLPGRAWALARAQTACGLWEQALSYWENVEYPGTCLNCMQDDEWHRHAEIAECLLALERYGELRSRFRSGAFDHEPRLALAYVDACRAQGELDEVAAELRSEHGRYVRAARDYVELLRLADGSDAAGILRLLEELSDNFGVGGSKELLAARALRLLDDLGDPAAEAAQAALDDRDPRWAQAVLADRGVESVAERIVSRLDEARGRKDLERSFYTLALLGTPEAYAVIGRHAKSADPVHARAAADVLRRYPQGYPVPLSVAELLQSSSATGRFRDR